SRIRQKNEEAIIQAAEDEFARHGFKGTSMNTIAIKAGLPKANLHYYFTNKRGGPGTSIQIPMMHKDDEGLRSHYITLEMHIEDSPRADEIIVVLGAANGG
ncbi:hypothetical protein PSYJA_38159, partial [Pseudomonas syringae pv. japonica str. M301072]